MVLWRAKGEEIGVQQQNHIHDDYSQQFYARIPLLTGHDTIYIADNVAKLQLLWDKPQ
jgi:hypothetical protein